MSYYPRKVVSAVVSFVLLFSVLSLFPTNQAHADANDDLRNRWKTLLTGGNSYDLNDADIQARIANIDDVVTNAGATGYWDTMDTSPGRTYLWSDLASPNEAGFISQGYQRLQAMALAYSTYGSSVEGNTALRNDIIGGLDWMYANRYNENKSPFGTWFPWEIGVPLNLNNITVLMYDDLSSTQITNYMNAVEHFQTDNTRSGTNYVWVKTIEGIRGVIIKDSASITSSRNDLSDFIRNVTAGEGFYSDGSFIMHEKVPSTGSYGFSLLDHLSRMVYLLIGSPWAFSSEDLDTMYQWVYDAFEPLIYQGGIMSMVMSRTSSRPAVEEHSVGHNVMMSVARIAQFAPAIHSDAFKSMVKHWVQSDTYRNFYDYAPLTTVVQVKNIMNDTSISPRGDLQMNKQYPDMDRTAHHGDGYAFGIAMHSSRIFNYESINGEAIKDWHTSDGMTYLYNSDLGQFSDAFWPTVNMYRLPGTTVEQNTEVPTKKTSTKGWAGGVTLDGTYGLSGMELAPYGQTLNAKKSWFMFDDEVVALGSGVSASDGKVVETIVENRKLNASGNNNLKVNGTNKITSLGWSETMSGVQTIHLAGQTAGSDIGYYFPGGAVIKGLREARGGAYTDINTNVSHFDDTPYTRNYMTLWFDHGVDPSGSSYAYTLLPGKTSAQVSAYASNPDITILENSEEVHAVKESELNIVAANFWTNTPQTVDIITSDKRSAVMVREADGEIEIAVTNPSRNNTTVNIEIDRSAVGTIAVDPKITVTQLSPTIKLAVNLDGAKGRTKSVKLDAGSGGSQTHWIHLENKGHTKYLQGAGNTPDGTGTGYNVRAVDTTYTGSWTQWKLVDAGGGYYRIENREWGKWLQATQVADASGTGIAVRMHDTTYTGDQTLWKKVDAGGGYFRLENKGTGRWLQCLNVTDIDDGSSGGGLQVIMASTSATGDWTKWREISAN